MEAKMDTTTPTKTMRDLLTKWAEVEPDLCELPTSPRLPNVFSVQVGTAIKNIFDPDDLSDFDLAWIQWAVQQAIVERGWYFETYYTPMSGYGVMVTIPSKCRAKDFSDTSIAEALLGAYLDTLEAE
jgi:hypothetical protein